MTRLLALATGACIAAALCALVATAKADENQVEDLTKLPIEDLMNIQVTSAAKRPQKLSDATAAIYVITQEDIRRSGAETIPDVLRMVPGLEVAQIDSSTWAITARGSNSRFANKLLVLIDGRTVYSPLFSGVFWDQQDTLLEDIDRIEVIRGPGAALYGANAVNGVINIITKSAKDTQGGLVAVGSGTDEPGMGEARFGGKLGANAYFRAYTKFFDREEHRSVIDTNGHDGWRYGRAGFRADG
jgi:iron complex outermembrane recepter protein